MPPDAMPDDIVVHSLESLERSVESNAPAPGSLSLGTFRRSFRTKVVYSAEQLMLGTPLLLGVAGIAFDFAYLLELYVLSKSETHPYSYWMFWAASLAFSFVTVMLVFFIFLAVHVNESVDMETWFHARGKQVKGLVCAVAFHYPACEILISNAFGLEIFNCPLSVLAIRRMRALAALAVLLDNVPKLVALGCIKGYSGSLNWVGFGSLVLAVVDIVGTLAASAMFCILTSEIERSRDRQRQLGRYRDGHKLFKLVGFPFAMGVVGLALQVCLVPSFFAMPVATTTATTTLGPTTLPPVLPTPRPSNCPKRDHGNSNRPSRAGMSHHSQQDQDTVAYLNRQYKSFDKNHKRSGKLGVYIKLTTTMKHVIPGRSCVNGCQDGEAECILSTTLYNHLIELQGSSTCSQISTDGRPDAGFVIDSDKAEKKYIRCAYIFDAGSEKRLNRGCGDAAPKQTTSSACDPNVGTSAFFNTCPSTQKTCTDSDIEVWSHADCMKMNRSFPSMTWQPPCYYYGSASPKGVNNIKDMVIERLKHQGSTPGDNTLWADRCKEPVSPGNCENRLATQNEVVMDLKLIQADLGHDPNVIRAFVYKPGHCALAQTLRTDFSRRFPKMATIPLVLMNTSADVVTENLFELAELDESCEHPEISHI